MAASVDYRSMEHNKAILRYLREDNTAYKELKVTARDASVHDRIYCLIGSNWQGFDELGHCIGQNTKLEDLKLYMDLTNHENENYQEDDDEYDGDPYEAVPESDPRMKQTVLFCKGLATNTSIKSLHVNAHGGNIFGLLNPFFRNNSKLKELVINECHGCYQWWDDLISALSDCVSLKNVKVNFMDLEGEQSGEIFQTLRIHQPQLEVLEFPGNQLNRRMFTGVEELTNLLRDSNHLDTLDISHNGIVGESLQEGLTQYLGKLSCLNLSYNMLSINDFDGYQAIAALLEDPSCNLHELVLNGSNIQGERLRSFARAMTKNKTLMILDLSRNSINATDWAVFSDVLCDTSSVNNTYNSNHNLWQLVKDGPVISIQGAPGSHQNRERLPGMIPDYLDLNKYTDKKKVAAMKILQYSRHNITMLPFFEWELSCLPIAMNWFDNAAPYYRRPPAFRKEVETSKLQAIYEFVRGMPVECADGYFGRNKKGGKKRARS